MSAFWETMGDAAGRAIETMGEAVTIGEVEVWVIVDEFSYQDGTAAGGRKAVVSGRMLVPAGVELRDGLAVVVRGADGKVDSWEPIGPDGARWARIGSYNRWSGEVPGV